MLRVSIFSFLFLLVSAPRIGNAQSHFSDCANLTGNNAVVLVPTEANIEVNGSALAKNSEIAVFTQDGVCAGAVVWQRESSGFTVWGDDSLTVARDGLVPGEALAFRIWDASGDIEYDGSGGTMKVVFNDAEPHLTTENAYAEDAVYQIRRLSFTVTTNTEGPAGPSAFALHPVYPNPFNTSTQIRYDLPRPALVRITIYNAAGAVVERLHETTMPAGSHLIRWNADHHPSGVYFSKVEAGARSEIQKMVLLR